MSRLPTASIVLGLAVVSAAWAAGPWPQWRGPARDGVSTETGLLDGWEGAPPLLWKAEGLGGGYAGAVVAGGRVYSLAERAGEPAVAALDDATGEPLWRVALNEPGSKGFAAMSTPVVDDGRVYALSGGGELVCLDAATGGHLWSRSFKRDFDGQTQDFGYAETPLVDGDKLVCSPGGPRAGMVSLDKRTGRELWRCALSFDDKPAVGASYASAVASRGAGVAQYVQLMKGGLVGVEAATGKQLWGYGRLAAINSPCTPIVRGDLVFAPCGWYVGSALLKLVPTESGVEAREIYLLRPERLATHSGGAVLVGGHVYASHVGGGNPQCVELTTGKLLWERGRGPGTGPAAVVAAENHLYFQYEDGTVVLVEATPEAYRLKGRFTLPDAAAGLAHPALAGGRLYLRARGTLYCFDLRKR